MPPLATPLQYFGRSVPLLLRRFPKLNTFRIKPSVKNLNPDNDNNTKIKQAPLKIIIPGDLDGRINIIVFGFNKNQMIKEMFSWYPLGKAMTVELTKKYKDVKIEEDEVNDDSKELVDIENLSTTSTTSSSIAECYTLFIFPRWYRLFHWWFAWRYQHLVRAYAVNKVKVKETRIMDRLAREAGREDPTQEIRGPIPVHPDAVDDNGDPLDEEDRKEIMEKRMLSYNQYCQVREDAKLSWTFADSLIKNTLVTYTNRKSFLEALQLPDRRRSYVVMVNRDGRIFWYEHERCTVDKANDAFDRFKLDHMKIDLTALPKHFDTRTKLYGKVDEYLTELTVGSSTVRSRRKQRNQEIEGGEIMGLEDGEKIGLEDGEKMGLEDGEKMGLEDGEKMGLEDGEKMGLEDGEKMGLEDGEKMGLEDGEKMGLEGGK